MPNRPRSAVITESLSTLLEDSLRHPFHVQGVLQSAGGNYQLLGLKVDLSWIQHRDITLAPFVADSEPDESDTGTVLTEYDQARFYLDYDNRTGTELMDVVIWHRHLSWDGATKGPWVRGETREDVPPRTEILDSILYHREIYIQCTNYKPGGSPSAEAHVYVAGAPAGVGIGFEPGSSSTSVSISWDQLLHQDLTDLYKLTKEVKSLLGDLDAGLSTLVLSGFHLEPDAPLELRQYGERKLAGIDVGAITPPAAVPTTTISFTGVNLNGRAFKVVNLTDRRLHKIASIVDPAGAAPGTITLEDSEPIVTANAILLVPFVSLPHAYSTLGDAYRVDQLNPVQDRYDAPAVVLDVTLAAVNPGNQEQIVSILAYTGATIQAEWTCAAGGQWSFDVEAILEGSLTFQNVNSWFSWTGAPGGAGVGGPTGNLLGVPKFPFKAYQLKVLLTQANAGVGAHSAKVSVNRHIW